LIFLKSNAFSITLVYSQPINTTELAFSTHSSTAKKKERKKEKNSEEQPLGGTLHRSHWTYYGPKEGGPVVCQQRAKI